MRHEADTPEAIKKLESAAAKRRRRACERKGPGYMRESFSYYGSWNARPEGARARDAWNRRRGDRS